MNVLVKKGHVLSQRVEEKDDFHARFPHQNSFGPHRNFDQAGRDWRTYFLNHDALHNLSDDVVFSALPRYRCEIGCQSCYLNDYWDRSFISSPWSSEAEAEILQTFTSFYRVGSIDDLNLLKARYPEWYDFYVRHSGKMEHNITDNGFFSQYRSLMEECHFDKTAYLSFTDRILDKVSVDKIRNMLLPLHARSPIRKMNFILVNGTVKDNPYITSLYEWIVENTNIEVFFHTDLRQDRDLVLDLKTRYGYDLPSIYYQENNHPSGRVIVCQILTETIQMRGRSFFTTLTGSTTDPQDDHRITRPFHVFDKWNPRPFMSDMLKGKLTTYAYYRDAIQDREDNRFYEYFQYCSENIQVRDDYTFIPAMMLRATTPLYRQLKDLGWIDTYAGLLAPDAKSVIPIVEIRS